MNPLSNPWINSTVNPFPPHILPSLRAGQPLLGRVFFLVLQKKKGTASMTVFGFGGILYLHLADIDAEQRRQISHPNANSITR
jgi:hypothetical protein